MKKKVLLGVFAFLTTIISLLSGVQVNAATDVPGRTYYTYMKTDDDVLFTSKERTFYKGKFSLEVSFDEWNSSICTSDQDYSYVDINLIDNGNKRTVAYTQFRTHLYTCGYHNFGSFAYGYYYYTFATFNGQQKKYCGYKSNSVVMKSNQ